MKRLTLIAALLVASTAQAGSATAEDLAVRYEQLAWTCAATLPEFEDKWKARAEAMAPVADRLIEQAEIPKADRVEYEAFQAGIAVGIFISGNESSADERRYCEVMDTTWSESTGWLITKSNKKADKK